MKKPNSMELSKSMTQMLEPLKDNWSNTMKTLMTDQEERVGRLERGFPAVSSSNLRIESLGCEIQGECQRLSSVSRRNKDMLPGLFSEAQASSSRIKSVELTVQHRLAEMDNKLQRIMELGLNSRVPPRMVNNVNSTIIQGAPTTVLECVSQEIEELSQTRYTDRALTEDLRVEVLKIQNRINSSMLVLGMTSLITIILNRKSNEQITDLESEIS